MAEETLFEIDRRGFLKLGGAAALATTLPAVLIEAGAEPGDTRKIKEGRKVPTICPYCAVGCGMLVTVVDGKVVDVEGDPQHPINEGALCSKGNAYLQLINSERRLKYPMKRTNPKKGVDQDPGWQRITWDEAFSTIAKKVADIFKSVYEKSVKHQDGYYWVGKDSPIALWGSAYFNNEECYLEKKLMSILGSLNVEHQARLCHASTVPALANTFGFGAQTNHPVDLKNAKCIMIIGSNAAEQHPIVFRWVQRAREAGAKLISLDPRFTRSSSWADIYLPFRPGSETAIYLGMIRYAIENNLVDKKFLESRTNAPYSFDGLEVGLDDPRSVFSKLKQLVEPYTPEEVSRITGIPKEKFEEICRVYTTTRPGSILYSMGTTQHTNATYAIRAMAILQLVLGNVGKPGAQIGALRGISNVQGSTDMNILSHLIMGYRVPPRSPKDVREYQKWKNDKAGYEKKLKDNGYWAYWRWGPARMFPTWEWLEQYWGVYIGTYPGVDPDNEPVISDIPIGVGYPTVQMYRAIKDGKIKVLFNFAGNNAVSLANAAHNVHETFTNSDLFMVCYEIFETETAHFADLLLPGTVQVERSGSVTNTGRWVQWRWKAVDPPGECMDELTFLTELFRRIRTELKKEGVLLPSELFEKEMDVKLNRAKNPVSGAVGVDANWPTSFEPTGTPEAVYKEIAHTNALYRFPGPGKRFSAYDLETAPELDGIMAKRRDPTPADEYDRQYGLFKNWGWSWMTNQRNLYDLNEPPEDKNRVRGFFVWWAHSPEPLDKPGGAWLGLDKAAIWAGGPTGLYDPSKPDWHPLKHGMPLHNEPVESPVPELAAKYPTVWDERFPVKKGRPEEFPVVLTTFRVTEHMQAGAMTRNLPWLVELHPEMFVEMDRELAGELNVKSGDSVRVTTARGSIEVKAIVTDRLKPLNVNGRKLHVVAMPWHWGFKGLSTGPIANNITIDAVDLHGNIPETKVCLCRVEKVS
uniref:4Fe-4S Mo/W bis-MGD-type domain-containing protein n=1 Tax=Caldiarchaeum subterraneum TaxID=311458 RepID=A0A7C5LDL2_CALS0